LKETQERIRKQADLIEAEIRAAEIKQA